MLKFAVINYTRFTKFKKLISVKQFELPVLGQYVMYVQLFGV